MKAEHRFVLCIKNEGCEDLEIRKVYQVLPDESAEKDDYIRVIDESGEDYLYPRIFFIRLSFQNPSKKPCFMPPK